MQAAADHYRHLERLYASAPINEYFRPQLRVSEGQAEVIMPVRRDFFHAAQAIHGAVYFKALDDAAFFAVASLDRRLRGYRHIQHLSDATGF
jgi:acyl-coenzyme A thioesterase PaaI-like protein